MKKRIGLTLASLMLLFTAACGAAQGGAKTAITVISREDGSGTRGAFIELFGIEEKDEAGNKVDLGRAGERKDHYGRILLGHPPDGGPLGGV